jgi:hypothetical protein
MPEASEVQYPDVEHHSLLAHGLMVLLHRGHGNGHRIGGKTATTTTMMSYRFLPPLDSDSGRQTVVHDDGFY